MNFPPALDHECPFCEVETELEEVAVAGLYQGYCKSCGEFIEFNYAEALQSEYDERRIDEIRDERLER